MVGRDAERRASTQDGLLLELARSLGNGAAIPAELWRRLRIAWPDAQLARLLNAAGVEPARWPEPLDGSPTPAALTARRARTDPRVVLAVASLAMFMAFMDDTVVVIAFPNLLHSFPHASVSGLSWVLNAYNIAFAALMVPAGRLADVLGRRRTYMVGVVLFTLGSALSAVAPSLGALIAARAIQGLGAAVVVPASLAIVLHATPPDRRAMAVSIWSATAALAAGIGPSIGGALVELDDWRLVFLINIPVGALAWWLARRQLVESRAAGRRDPPDLGGAALLALTVGAVTLAITEGPDWGWASAGVIAAAAVASAAGAVVARRVMARPAAVLDLELLRMPGFRITSALTVVAAGAFFALNLAYVLLLIQVWGYSTLKTGLAITPAPFLTAVTAGLAGPLSARVDPRRLAFVGGLLWMSAPIYLIARAGAHPQYLSVYLPAAALDSLGVGLAWPLINDAAVAAAPRGRYASASALNGTIRQVGAAIGIAIFAALLAGGDTSLHHFREVWIYTAIAFGVFMLGSVALPPFRQPDLADEEDLAQRRAALGRVARPALRRPQPAAPVTFRDDGDESLLGEVALLSGLPPDARIRLAARCDTVRVEAGEFLFRQGDPADAMYIVRSGRLEVLRENAGKPSETLRDLGRGSVVGELGLLLTAPRAASVRARRDALLLRLDRAAFEELLTSSTATAVTIARTLGVELARSRPVDDDVPASVRAATVAVVRRPGDERAARGEADLYATLRGLCSVARLDRQLVAELAPDEPRLGVALARVLDRIESGHDTVLLSAVGRPGDEWMDRCLRQADRTLLFVDGDPDGWAREPQLAGCDVVLFGPAGRPEVTALLDALEPRSTHRVRDSSDISRLARRIAGRSVGVVLSGGGARAFAHLGVVEELLAAGIVIDRVGGVSMGAFIGALLAQGLDAGAIEDSCYREFVRRNPLSDYRIPRVSLLRGGRAAAMLARTFSGLIEDLPRSFYCVTTDMIAAELVVHRRGELQTVVGASMCLPGVFPPVPLGDRLLVDGGVLDNLPIEIMAAEAEGPVIASDVTQPEQRRLAPGEPLPEVGLVGTLARVMLLGTTDTEELGRRHSALYIRPAHEGIGRLEFHQLDAMRDAGRRAALAALENAPPSLFPG